MRCYQHHTTPDPGSDGADHGLQRVYARNPWRQPPDDLLATISGLINLRLTVRRDADTGCIEIALANLPDRCSLVLAPPAALELSLRLIGAVARLRGWAAP
jgi:hypothetical protein